MRLAILMTWALLGFAAAVDAQEPPPLLLPAPRPMPQAGQEPKKSEKTTPAPGQNKESANGDKAAPAPQQTKDEAQTEKGEAAPAQPKEDAKTDKKAPLPPEPKEPGKTDNAEQTPSESKEASKTEEAAGTPPQAAEPLMPPNAAFMDPRAFTWTQHRLPPPDKPCLEIACQMRMCLGDHRCWREKICDYLFHWPCPSQLLFGKHCPSYP